jgi:single-strand DNA-binding protein
MAFSLNQVQLIGRLGKDPEQSSEKAPVKSSLVTDRNYRDEKGENGWSTKSTWHNLVSWGKAGENFMANVKKGDTIYLQGNIDNRTVEGDDGSKRTYTDIVVENFRVVQRKGAGNGENGGNGGGQPAAPSKSQNTERKNEVAEYADSDDPF